jgi:hypothetical protein
MLNAVNITPLQILVVKQIKTSAMSSLDNPKRLRVATPGRQKLFQK